MNLARAKNFFAYFLVGLVLLASTKVKALGFTDNRPFGTPKGERTEKRFALILPFGVGQFVQDRYTVGSIFLVAEAALLGASYLSYERGQSANRQKKNYIATTCPVDSSQCNNGELNRYKTAVRNADQAMVLLGFSALGTMIGGAIEAVIHDRQWSLQIGLEAPPLSSDSQTVCDSDAISKPNDPMSNASLRFDLNYAF
jgi:hypothetical protein